MLRFVAPAGGSDGGSGRERHTTVETPERRKAHQGEPVVGSPRRRSTDVVDATADQHSGRLPALPGVPEAWELPEQPRAWMSEEEYASERASGTQEFSDDQWTESLYAERWVSAETSTPVEPAAVVLPARHRTRRRISSPQLFLAVDLVCLLAPATWDRTHYRAILASGALSVAFFWAAGLYRHRLRALVLDEIPALLCSMLAASGISATIAALRHPSSMVAGYLLVAVLVIGLVLVGRTLTSFSIRLARRRKLIVHPTVVVGTGMVADRMVATLQHSPDYGLDVVGYLADRAAFGSAVDTTPYLGRISSLAPLIDRLGIEVVLLADRGFDEHEMADFMRQAAWGDCEVMAVPRLHEGARQQWTSDLIGPVPVIRFGPHGRDGARWKVKRLFDIAVSAFALLVLSPLLALCALAVRLDTGPDVIFRQIRVGRDGKEFEILKFRSLRPLNDAESQMQWNISNDSRMSAVGKFMRKTSLDELPQLWTILRGDMTIVGPRPERPHFVEKFSAETPDYILRHRVPCGLTGLAQVNGMRGDTSIADRASYDNYYIENWSLWLDVKIILRTFGEVLFGSGG